MPLLLFCEGWDSWQRKSQKILSPVKMQKDYLEMSSQQGQGNQHNHSLDRLIP